MVLALCAAAVVSSSAITAQADSAEGQLAVTAVVQTKCAVAESASQALDVSCSEPAKARVTTSPVQTIRINGHTQEVRITTVNF